MSITGKYVKNYNASNSRPYITELDDLKQKTQDAFSYFRENNERFINFQKFICKTAITDDARQKLITMQKPPLEFNETEAYINKQVGEFMRQSPSFDVHPSGSVIAGNMSDSLISTCDVIEGFVRHLFDSQKTDNIYYHTMTELLRGGFSVWNIYTEYEHEMSMDQEICVTKEDYPTMCFFDPMAVKSHKGDGDYCGRIIPYKIEDAERMFGKDIANGIAFSRSFGSFNWAYKNSGQKIILIGEMFKKKKIRKKIVKLSDGQTMTNKDYKQLLLLWDEMGFMEKEPVIVEERMTDIEVVCRYLFSEKKVISYDETDYRYLPLIFIDGSSVMLQDSNGGSRTQMTRPYVYNLKSIQELKNMVGQQVAFEIENTMAHKLMMASETIDMTQMQQLRNSQIPDVIIWKSRVDNDPDSALPQPQLIQRPNVPQIIPQTFFESSKIMQSILGSYDALMGVQGNDVSGMAIKQGALQSSQGAAPYLMGFINGMNRAGSIIVDLIPKYYKTPRTIPVLDKEGKRKFEVINDKSNPGSIFMNYSPYDFNIVIEAGVNAEIQKQLSMEQIISLGKVSPLVAEFIGGPGLPFLLDNMDIRNGEAFKLKCEEFIEQKQQQIAQKPKVSPEEIEQARLMLEKSKLEQKNQEIQSKTALDAGKLELENRKVDVEFMGLVSNMKSNEIEAQVKMQKAESEDVRSAALLAIETQKHENDMKHAKLDRVERALVHQDKMNIEHKRLKKRIDTKNDIAKDERTE